MGEREFAGLDRQHDWNENEMAYRAGEQAGHIGAPSECPQALVFSERFWRNGYAYGVMMRGRLLPDNRARFPLAT